ADALAGAGYKVRVIAADYSLWARDADREFAGRAWDVARTVPFGPHAPARYRVSQIVSQRLGRLAVALGSRHPRAVEAAWHPV
ncbi:MAG: hypothetical protein GWO02_10505, partial [Gammaproteobacteria bacterium]|nr:hypothetical protein [Gammaproteobacteria bacterium]